MGLGNSENDLIVDEGDGGGGGGGEVAGGGFEKSSSGTVLCSICIEVVTDTGDRSWAKLQCGHRFHLDCIGSAFNTNGVMQCPNCRKVEKGQWLFATGCHSLPESNMDEWTHEPDTHYSVSELSFGVHYCPFGGSLTRLPASFEEGEFTLNAYHDVLGQHAVFAEHTATISSASNACPYIAYFGPLHPSPSSSSPSPSDTPPNLNGHWMEVPTDMPSSYGFPAAMDIHYHSWEHQSLPFSTASSRIGGSDQSSLPPNAQRAVGRSNNIGHPRAGSFMHPFVVNPGSGARAGTSVPPPSTPAYQGSNARARDRVQALQDYYQQQQPGTSPPVHAPPMVATSARRPSSSISHRGQSRAIPPTPYFFPSGGTTLSAWNYQEPDNASSRTGFRAWEPLNNNNHPEGDSGWGTTYQQGGGGSESGGGIRPTGSFRQRQNRS